MKKLKITCLILLLSFTISFAQKFAYVDTEYILQHIPEYSEAQQKLDDISAQWQSEIERKYAEIDKLYKAFQAEHILLTEEMKRKREEEIIKKERGVKDFQKQKFGYQGELFRKRQELIKPIQDKVYDAVQKIAKERALGVIFDKSSSNVTMIYTNPKYDESDRVIRALGYTPGEINKKEDDRSDETKEVKPAATEAKPKETKETIDRK